MKPLHTLYSVLGITLTGEAVADWLASHAEILACTLLVIAGLFIRAAILSNRPKS